MRLEDSLLASLCGALLLTLLFASAPPREREAAVRPDRVASPAPVADPARKVEEWHAQR